MMKRTLIAAALLCGSAQAQENKVDYTGTVHAEAPVLNLVSNNAYEEYYQGVIDYTVTAKPANAVCNFRGSEIQAIPSFRQNEVRCFVEWVGAPPGLEISQLDQRGYFSNAGKAEFPYKIWVFSGKNDEKHLVAEGVYEVDVLEPEAPKILNAKVKWTDRESEGFEHINHNPDASIVRVELIAEKRPYRQKMQRGGDLCHIGPEDTSCTVNVSEPIFFGSRGDIMQGLEDVVFHTDSHNDFWGMNVKVPLAVEWDYRPPKLEFAKIHIGHDVTEPTEIDIDGQKVTIQPEEAIVVVSTPHSARPSDWWYLANSELEFHLDDDVILNPYIYVGRFRVGFKVPNFSWDQSHNVPAKQTPELVGNKLIYRYDLSEIPDGRYNIVAQIKDKYDNGQEENIENMLIDRFAPVTKVLVGTKDVTEGYPVYFTNDLTVATTGGWNDGSEIVEATYAGQPLEMECYEDNIGHCEITSIVENLELGQEYELNVVAEDDVGNQTVTSMMLPFAPVEFELYGLPDEVVAEVQEIRIKARQTVGSSCAYAASEEIAKIRATTYRNACTIDWYALPDGMEKEDYASQSYVSGVIKGEGSKTIGFDVYFHNQNGDKMHIQRVEDTIDIMPPAIPEVSLSHRNRLEEGVYGLPFGKTTLTRYAAAVSPGNVTVEVHNKRTDEKYYKEHGQRRSRDPIYSVRGSVEFPEESVGPIFEKYEVDIKASYDREPDRYGVETIEVVNLPSRRIRAYIEIAEDEGLSTDTLMAKVMVGKYNRREDVLHYDPEEYGEYDVHVVRTGTGEQVPITEKVRLPASGIIEIPVPADEIFTKARTVRAIADLVSPHPEYSLSLRSMSERIYVFKGTAVEGELTTRRISGPAPLSTSVRFEHETREDSRVSSDVTWEVSDDGVTWTTNEEEFGTRDRMRIVVPEAGTKFVRAKVSNIKTGEVTVTDALELIAYDQPSIRIAGPKEVYRGAEAKYQIVDFGEEVQVGDGEVQWSFDGGETWVDGEPTLYHSFTEEKTYIHARYRYAETPDSIKEPAWDYTRHRVSSVEEEPLRIRPSVPRRVDVGYDIELDARVSNPNRYIEGNTIVEWTMPTGETLSGEVVNYTVPKGVVENAEYVTFHVAAWVEGFKETTFSEKLVDIQVLDYHFPESRLSLRSNVLIAPAKIRAAVNLDYIYAPGVRYGAEFLIDESAMELSRVRDLSSTITINEPGLHRIDVRVFDSRGNERTMTEFLEIVEAPPMEGEVSYRTSNRYDRAPLRLSARVSAEPGHPSDRRGEVFWYLNGEYLEDFERVFARIDIEEPGTHLLEAKVTTEYGQEGVFKKEVVVNENKLPTCEPAVETSSIYVQFYTNCDDEDGRVVSYDWTVNGEERSFGSYFRSRLSQSTEPMDVEFVATDDSGGTFKGKLYYPGYSGE